MSIKYNLTPIEILNVFGYTKPTAKNKLEQFEKKNNLKLPALLFDFLSFAKNNPLFATADIWAQKDSFPFFLYEYIEEGIEDCKQDFDDPEFCEENYFYPFSKIPKEQWSETVANYLQIGSDYAAGVVFWGIEEKDLTYENPPVYIIIIEETLTDWQLMFNTLSDYLIAVILNILACENYDTAEYVLHEKGWNFYEEKYADKEELKEHLSQKKIDLSAMTKNSTLYDTNSFYRYCFDEKEKSFYLIKNDVSMTIIKAE